MNRHPVLNFMIEFGPSLKKLFVEDVTIGIADTKEILISIPGDTFSLGIEPGSPLHKGDGIYEAVTSRKPFHNFIPEEVFGTPLVAKTIPIFSEGELIGGIGVGVSVRNYDRINDISKSLFELVKLFSESLKELTDSSGDLTESISYVSNQSNIIIESNKDIDKIVKLVKEVSEQTNILGLNASIEAARAGEAGQGFGIVANEIRSLASTTKAHSESIKNTIDEVDRLMDNLNKNIIKINEETSEQNTITNDLLANIEKIRETAKELSDYAGENLNQR